MRFYGTSYFIANQDVIHLNPMWYHLKGLQLTCPPIILHPKPLHPENQRLGGRTYSQESPLGWRNILYGRIYVDFSFLAVHKVCTKAILLGERSVRIREVKGSNPSRSTFSSSVILTLLLFFFAQHCRRRRPPDVGMSPLPYPAVPRKTRQYPAALTRPAKQKSHEASTFHRHFVTFKLVRGRGFEPPRINHTHLKRARLPVPPPSHTCSIVAIPIF